MAEIVVETRALVMRFGGVTAVDGVDFALREHELRCLIGPNGAGKSTFFKCLTGMLKPSNGEVLIRDRDVTGWDPHRVARLGIGVKTQVPSVMDGLTARENIWLAARRCYSGSAVETAVSECIDRLGLAPIAKTEVGHLAHGQRQRVELGIVLSGRPWLVLLDEPAAGLSGDEVEQLAEIIRDINRTASIIVVEHDMQFIQAIAKRVTVFYQGAVLVEDDVEAVMTDPRVRDVYLGKKHGRTA